MISIPSGNKALLGEYLNISLRNKRSNFQPAQRHAPTHNWEKTKDTKGKKQVQFSLKLHSVRKVMNMSSKTTSYERNKETWGEQWSDLEQRESGVYKEQGQEQQLRELGGRSRMAQDT